MAAAEAVGDETRAVQTVGRGFVVAMPEGCKSFDQRYGGAPAPFGDIGRIGAVAR